jgi:hypothetical protein
LFNKVDPDAFAGFQQFLKSLLEGKKRDLDNTPGILNAFQSDSLTITKLHDKTQEVLWKISKITFESSGQDGCIVPRTLRDIVTYILICTFDKTGDDAFKCQLKALDNQIIQKLIHQLGSELIIYQKLKDYLFSTDKVIFAHSIGLITKIIADGANFGQASPIC